MELFGGNWVLAALSSSRSLVARWLVGPSVGWSVGHLCEKVTFRVSNGNFNINKAYLPTYLTVVNVVTVMTGVTLVPVNTVVTKNSVT